MTCKHFRIYELVDRQTYMNYGERAWTLISPDLQEALDGVREFFNQPVTVNNWYGGGPFQYRGYRGPACPIGAEHSQHKLGMAADFDVHEHTAEDARKIIKDNEDDPLLAKIMRMEDGVNWVHIDLKELADNQKRIYLLKV
jgi:hypothetical protein